MVVKIPTLDRSIARGVGKHAKILVRTVDGAQILKEMGGRSDVSAARLGER